MGTVNKVYPRIFVRNHDQGQTRAKTRNTAGKGIAQAFEAGLNLVGRLAPVAAQFHPAAGALAGLANAPLGGGLGGLGGAAGMGGAEGGFDQMELLRLQEEIQTRSQIFQTVSNVSKAEHDAKMNAVRNVRP